MSTTLDGSCASNMALPLVSHGNRGSGAHRAVAHAPMSSSARQLGRMHAASMAAPSAAQMGTTHAATIAAAPARQLGRAHVTSGACCVGNACAAGTIRTHADRSNSQRARSTPKAAAASNAVDAACSSSSCSGSGMGDGRPHGVVVGSGWAGLGAAYAVRAPACMQGWWLWMLNKEILEGVASSRGRE